MAAIEFEDWVVFDNRMGDRIKKFLLPESGLEHQKVSSIPVEEAGECLPAAPGPGALAGNPHSAKQQL